MKIAFFTETFLPKVDGIVTRLTKTIQNLVQSGDEVTVFCPEGCPPSYMGAKVVGSKPSSIKHRLSTIKSFSTASFLGFGR